MSDWIKQRQRQIDCECVFSEYTVLFLIDWQSYLQLPDGRLPLLDLLQVFLSDDLGLRLHLGIAAGMRQEEIMWNDAICTRDVNN